MNASRTDYSRLIDWSAVKGDAAAQMRRQVLRFVGGIRSDRTEAVTKAQILAWFRGTPAPFVEAAILEALTLDELDIFRTALVRRSNARSVYELTDVGRTSLRKGKEPNT